MMPAGRCGAGAHVWLGRHVWRGRAHVARDGQVCCEALAARVARRGTAGSSVRVGSALCFARRASPLPPPPSVSLELPRRERLPPRGDRGQAKGCGDPPTNPCRPYVGTPQGHENEAQRRQRRALQLHAAARPGAPPATSRHPSWGAAAAVASGMKTSLRLSTPGDPFCPVNEWFLEPYVVPQRPCRASGGTAPRRSPAPAAPRPCRPRWRPTSARGKTGSSLA